MQHMLKTRTAPSLRAAAGVAEARPYYGISEAARLLGVNRVTVWRWVAAGRLPVWRVGPRTVRVRREDLQRLLVRAGRDAPSLHEGDREHFVQFYESDEVLADAVAEYV